MKKNILLIIILGIVLGVLVSFGKEYFFNKNFSLSDSFLSSSIFDASFANISGNIIEKNKDYFLLKNNNKIYVIYVIDGLGITKFVKNENEVNYEDIPVGTNVRGGVSVVTTAKSAEFNERKSGDIIAHFFRIIDK